MAKDTTASGNQRWKPKTPAEIVLGQIDKQREKVKKLKEDLAKEEQVLQKLEAAKKIFDAAS